jgi:hypothetical protein
MAEKRAAQLRKITIKGVMGENPDVEKLIKKDGKRMDLCLIYGIVRRFKPDQSDKGAFVRFYGQIRATNLVTGELFQAGQVILPGQAQDALYGAMDGVEGANVHFGVKVGVKYDGSSIVKYVYTVESIMPPAENDPLLALEQAMGMKALPKPKESAKAS